jgi:hypothetical protein
MDLEHTTSRLRTWLLVAACVAIVAFQGWLAYTVIGDLGQPDWDYRPVKDVPGESPYTLTEPCPFPSTSTANRVMRIIPCGFSIYMKPMNWQVRSNEKGIGLSTRRGHFHLYCL